MHDLRTILNPATINVTKIRNTIRIAGPSSLSRTWNAFSNSNDSSSKTSVVSGIQWWANLHWSADRSEFSGQEPKIWNKNLSRL